MVPLLKRLWEGDVAHDGEFWRFPSSTAVPKPQQEKIPVWLAARDPNSFGFAVGEGCNVQVTPLASGEGEVASLMERFNTACAAHPDRPRPQILLLMHAYVATDEADVQQASRELGRFYCYFDEWFKNKRPIERGFVAPLSDIEIEGSALYPPARMRDNLVIGTAGSVIQRIRAYEAMGYDQFSFWIDSLMPFDRKAASLRRFIMDVMPAFRI